jgi:hypothetical protein
LSCFRLGREKGGGSQSNDGWVVDTSTKVESELCLRYSSARPSEPLLLGRLVLGLGLLFYCAMMTRHVYGIGKFARHSLLLLEYETGGRLKPSAALSRTGLFHCGACVHYPSTAVRAIYPESIGTATPIVQDGLDYFYTNTVISGEDAVMGHRLRTVLRTCLSSIETSDAANRPRFFSQQPQSSGIQ